MYLFRRRKRRRMAYMSVGERRELKGLRIGGQLPCDGKRPIIKIIKESGAETFRPFFICTVLYRMADCGCLP